jgi:serine/threonine-protein kinase
MADPRPDDRAETPPDAQAAAPPPPELEDTEEYRVIPEGTIASPPPNPGPRGPAANTPAARPGGQKISVLGGFRLLRRLGEGSMGTVYHARRVRDGWDVALKVIAPRRARDSAFVRRFKREARLLARLDHLHIVRCYGAGAAHGWHFLAMEYLAGGSLQVWLDRLGKFPVGDAVHVLVACAQGLDHAHELNLVHRDVKPENILLTAEGVVKVADLGLAKALDDDLSVTQTGTGMGTPLYVAPEQAFNAKHVDGRSDLYSLGCMFYHLLAGRPPFAARNLIDVLLAKKEGDFPPVRSLAPEVPEALEPILARLLAPEPAGRYPSCGELVEDLRWLGLAHPTLSFFAAGPGR